MKVAERNRATAADATPLQAIGAAGYKNIQAVSSFPNVTMALLFLWGNNLTQAAIHPMVVSPDMPVAVLKRE
jgi:hypothetical protein